MEITKYYLNGEQVEVIDLFDENGKLIAVVEYLDEDIDDGAHYCRFDKLEQKTIKF